MKILTKEEEQAHYRATLKGGTIGTLGGLAVGFLGVWGATRRYQAFRQLTLPLKAFLISSSATFAGIIAADHSSRKFESDRNQDNQFLDQREQSLKEATKANMTFTQRAMEWGREERYKIVGGSWIASMITAFALVGRNPYLSGQQKLVQARVYAQGLTLAVLCATAAFEIGDQRKGEGRWETVKYIDPNDPEHKHLIEKQVHHERYQGEDLWRDMVDAEEQRLKERDRAVKAQEEKDRKAGKLKKKDGGGGGEKKQKPGKKEDEKKDDKKQEKGDEDKEEEKGNENEGEGEEEEEEEEQELSGLKTAEGEDIPKAKVQKIKKASDSPSGGAGGVP